MMDGIRTAECMLNEVPYESLQHLLTAMNYEISPPGCTQIPALDAHFFATTSHHSLKSSLNRGDVIEIQGPASSGKTHLLSHFIITCIMPSFYLTIDLGGWQKAAIVFDSDGSFSIRRLRILLLSRLRRLMSSAGNIEFNSSLAEELADAALERVHVFRPTCSNQLAATLFHLPAYHAKHLAECELGLLAIDSVSSFYWLDRFIVEQFRSAPGAFSDGMDPKRAIPSWTAPLQHVLTALQRLRISHGQVTVLTNWGINPLPNPSPCDSSAFVTSYKQHLHPFLSHDVIPNPVTTLVPQSTTTPPIINTMVDSSSLIPPLTYHITLPFIPVPPFYLGIPIEEAEAEEEKYRNEVVAKGEVTGIVRTAGSPRVGRFVFRISDHEVLL